MSDIAAEAWKRQARTRARAARRALGATERAHVAAGLVTHLADEIDGLPSRGVVLGYAAMPEEIDVGRALRRAEQIGLTVALPRVAGPGLLTLHRADADLEGLRAGAFGVREPPPRAPLVDPEDVSLVLVPGLAFDRRGGRLGMGGGFYDRLLPTTTRARRLGICMEALLWDEVEMTSQDARMDAVVTEAAVYRC